MDRGPGTLFEPVRDGDDLFRVNLGPSLATALLADVTSEA